MKLLYKNKQIKRSDDSSVKMLMPSLISIGVCVTCLLGTTFAWLTDNAYTSIQSIEFANYGLKIKIDDSPDILEGNIVKHTFSKKKDNSGYVVTIEGSGTATKGYVKIDSNLKDYSRFTDKINKVENKWGSITFTLYPEENEEYTFTAIWGEYLGSTEGIIQNNGTVGTRSSQSYVEEVNNNVNNNLSIPNVGNVESTTSQPEEVETIKPSEEPKVEEDNEITESDSSDTEIDNSDIILDTTEESSEENEPDTAN